MYYVDILLSQSFFNMLNEKIYFKKCEILPDVSYFPEQFAGNCVMESHNISRRMRNTNEFYATLEKLENEYTSEYARTHGERSLLFTRFSNSSSQNGSANVFEPARKYKIHKVE